MRVRSLDRFWHLTILACAGLAVAGCQDIAPPERVPTTRLQTRPIDDKLFNAIRKKDAKAVKQLLEKGASPRANEANDWPAIVMAAGESLEIVKLLLAKGADINAQQPDQGWTPLTQAITHRKSDITVYLLDHGADPSLSMNEGSTPLHMAVRFGDTKAVEALLRRKVNVNARSKEEPNVIHSPEEDERVGNVFEPGYRQSGRTPLFEMATQWREHPEIAKLLLSAGADPKAVDDNGWTLLHEAAKWGSTLGVEELLKLGADPNARSRQDFTPLHLAMRSGFGVPAVPVIRKLLSSGADPNALNKQGQTPEALLRADAARLLGSTNLSPAANSATWMRGALRSFNDGLQAVHPGAEPIGFPEPAVKDGWNIYPPLTMGSLGDPGTIERKVKSDSRQTLLSLTFRPGSGDPSTINLEEVELNAYEPLDKMPTVLQANKERLVAFPPEAGPLGGAVRVKYSYREANRSGSGELGDPSLIPNPSFVQHNTPKGWEVGISCYQINRPLELRIDTLTVDGKELKPYRGKLILVRPSSGDLGELGDPGNSTTLLTLKKSSKAHPKLIIRYSYRLVGNKKWRTGNMAL